MADKTDRPTLTIMLGDPELRALRKLVGESGGLFDLDAAAHFGLVEFLRSHGYLEIPDEIDEESETAGEA